MAAKRSKSKPSNTATPKEQEKESKYPRHSLDKALRIPKALVEQNAGKECSDAEAAVFVKVGFNGPFRVEISSASKYGLLERPSAGHIQPTDLAKRILRPQQADDVINGLREAALNAPVIKEVYNHYRGENLPDIAFFENAITDKFGVPASKSAEFLNIFKSTMIYAKLIDETGGKTRLIDVSHEVEGEQAKDARIKQLGKTVHIQATDTCFVVMPFAAPIGDYYKKIYEKAITKAGLTPVRADADMFGTGKIIDQIWSGINSAKVLVAELTGRNPNVFYELGLAHALKKPVVLVSRGAEDVPFDLQHIRVIYYDVNDPFWGDNLIAKVAENVISALNNPSEAIFADIISKDKQA